MSVLFALLAPVLLIGSLYFVNKAKKAGKNPKTVLMLQIGAFFAILLGTSALGMGQVAFAATSEEVTSNGLGLLAMALSTGLAGIGGGIGVSGSAAAAIGAVSENSAMFGRSLIFVALAEGIALYGLLISFIIMGKLV